MVEQMLRTWIAERRKERMTPWEVISLHWHVDRIVQLGFANKRGHERLAGPRPRTFAHQTSLALSLTLVPIEQDTLHDASRP
jgi:hypothetical protein